MSERVQKPAVPETREQVESWSRYFLRLQKDLGARYIVPLLRGWGVEPSRASVLDLGCGEGGVASAFAEAGAIVTGVDLSADRIAAGKRLAESAVEKPAGSSGKMPTGSTRAGRLTLVHGDIFDPDLGSRFESSADIVLLLDVIEHVEDPAALLSRIRRLIRPGGRLFVSFPPFYSAFGLHQQLMRNSPLRRIPWVQLLPWRFYSRWVRGPWADDIRGVREAAVTIKKFRSVAVDAGFKVSRSCEFLTRPIHHLKFGVPVIGAGFIGKLPFLREIAVSGAFFLLAPAGAAATCARRPVGVPTSSDNDGVPVASDTGGTPAASDSRSTP